MSHRESIRDAWLRKTKTASKKNHQGCFFLRCGGFRDGTVWVLEYFLCVCVCVRVRLCVLFVNERSVWCKAAAVALALSMETLCAARLVVLATWAVVHGRY